MKIMLNAQELRDRDACQDGLATFIEAHGEQTVTIKQAYDSNGWDDIWWYISSFYDHFPPEFKRDLRLLSADYAERVLPIFEKHYPDDPRPRDAIQALRDFAHGLINDAAWDAARAAA